MKTSYSLLLLVVLATMMVAVAGRAARQCLDHGDCRQSTPFCIAGRCSPCHSLQHPYDDTLCEGLKRNSRCSSFGSCEVPTSEGLLVPARILSTETLVDEDTDIDMDLDVDTDDFYVDIDTEEEEASEGEEEEEGGENTIDDGGRSTTGQESDADSEDDTEEEDKNANAEDEEGEEDEDDSSFDDEEEEEVDEDDHGDDNNDEDDASTSGMMINLSMSLLVGFTAFTFSA